MGWDFGPKPADVKRYFFDYLTHESDTRKYKCLDVALTFKEMYAAVELIHKDTGKREVVAICAMLQYTRDGHYNFGKKMMDETMGPYMYACPRRILEMLTPTDNEFAQGWRKRNWERINRQINRQKIGFGDTVRFEEPVDGFGAVFTKVKYGRRRNVFRSEQTGGLVRLNTYWLDRPFEFIPKEYAEA